MVNGWDLSGVIGDEEKISIEMTVVDNVWRVMNSSTWRKEWISMTFQELRLKPEFFGMVGLRGRS